MEVGEEQVGPRSIERIADKALQCRLICGVRIAPARLLLALANRLDHVRFKPLGEIPHPVAIIRSQTPRPGAEERLIEEILDVSPRHGLVVDLAAARAVEAQPARDASPPLARYLGDQRQADPGVFAAL